jgi:plastocyanin domain-containing protein
MSLDKILVSFIGVGAIIFIYWFFLMKKKRAIVVSDSVDIKVEGGYSPDTIVIPAGKPTTINFLRTDPSSCLEEVVVSDFKIKKFLPLNEQVTIKLAPEKPGEYDFACGMNMYHGKIIVK